MARAFIIKWKQKEDVGCLGLKKERTETKEIFSELTLSQKQMKSTWASANPQHSQLQLLFTKNT